ncbi:MAG: carboxypeptidase regulatory-like domain-containing protein [Ekhidna sp.]|nr:carboxypeptidase regulatory-like domain-containing protein [Ekhidna sp.]
MSTTLNGIVTPVKAKIAGTPKSLNGIVLPQKGSIVGTPKSLNGIVIGITYWCFRVEDQLGNPIEGASIRIVGDSTSVYTTDANGRVQIPVMVGTMSVSKSGFRTQSVPFDFTAQDPSDCSLFTVTLVAFTGMATKILIEPLTPIPTEREIDFCFCDFECKLEELALFDNTDSTDTYINDYSSFLYRKTIEADTITIKLFKDDQELATITDNTLGTFYPTFTNSPLFVAFVANWRLIHNIYGDGLYQVRAEKNILGSDTTDESRYFRVLPYSAELANETIVLETFQTGNIVGGIDYSKFDIVGGFPRRFRIHGEFVRTLPETVISETKTASREWQQIQDKIINKYELRTDLIPSDLYRLITNDAILSNAINVYSYNVFQEIFDRKQLRFMSIKNLEQFQGRRGYTVQIEFKDIVDDLIKRNF